MKTFINYLNENKIESVMKIHNGHKYWVIPNTEKDKFSYLGLGVLHREDGPAFEGENGDIEWLINGFYHRENGPAVKWKDGTKFWYIDGKKHREDGPAIEYDNGALSWYLKNRQMMPTIEMMEKYIRLNPDNIFKHWNWPKEIQALAIELGGDEIRDRLIKEKKIHPSLIIKGLSKLDKRGFFN